MEAKMPRQTAQKRYDGWIYVFRWSNDDEAVKIGFSSDLKRSLSEFLTASRHQIVVLKAFKANKETEKDLHDRFEACRTAGEWFLLTDRLNAYLREEAICQTREARKEVGREYDSRIIWRPLVPMVEDRLEKARSKQKLPRYINNAKRFVLWAIWHLDQNDFFPSSHAIIHHQANCSLYQPKTIYNAIDMLLDDGLIKRDADKTFALTDDGSLALSLLKERNLKRKENRRSVSSLCPK